MKKFDLYIENTSHTKRLRMLHLLNLACIKHTGQPLPSSATGANRWRYLTEDCYDLDDNGEVIPKVKKLAILRGVPDIRPCVIHDDPDLAICRQLIVGELKERMDIHRGEGVLRRAMGSMGLTINLMKHYRNRYHQPTRPPIMDNPMEVMKFLSTQTTEGIKILAKILISYWSSGEYNLHYDYVRFRRIRREMTTMEFMEWIKKRLLLDRQRSFDPAYELGAFRLTDNYRNDKAVDIDTACKCLVKLSEFYTNAKTNHYRRQTATIKAFFHTCKADRIYVGIDKLPEEISEENLKFYKKFWDKKPEYNIRLEQKLMGSKWSNFDVKDAKNNSKILTGGGDVRKTKFAVDSYYELCMIAIGSSLDLNGAIWNHYTANRWGKFNQAGKDDWRLTTRKKHSEKLSSDEILRIFAPDKKEEKKIVMDKFVSSFSE